MDEKDAVDYLINRIQWTPRLLGPLISLFTLLLALNMLTPAYAGKILYSIQIGAFNERRHAMNEVNKLKGSGRHTFYRLEKAGNRGKLYRVYVETYKVRRDAEREARKLKQLGLVKDYIIKAIRDEEEATPTLVIQKITLNQEKGGTEILLIHSNRFFWPSVLFSLEEKIPRLTISINNATTLGKSLSDPALHGELIKGVRNPSQQKGEQVKIILDLAAGRKYEVKQVFNEMGNVYNLEIGEKKVKQAR